MKSLLELRKRPGDEITAADWNELLAWIAKATPQATPGQRRRELSDGVILSRKAAGLVKRYSHAWKVSLEEGAGGRVRVTMRAGSIGGVEAAISGRRLNEPDSNGVLPFLEAARGDFQTSGPDTVTTRAMVYARVTVGKDFEVEKVEPTILSAPPKAQAWTAWKLLAVLLRDASDPDGAIRMEQVALFHLGFAASDQRKTIGRFRAWFWAT